MTREEEVARIIDKYAGDYARNLATEALWYRDHHYEAYREGMVRQWYVWIHEICDYALAAIPSFLPGDWDALHDRLYETYKATRISVGLSPEREVDPCLSTLLNPSSISDKSCSPASTPTAITAMSPSRL